MEDDQLRARIIIRGYEGDVSGSLGIEASTSARKGDVHHNHQGSPVLYEENMWILDSEVTSGDLEDRKIRALLDKISPVRGEFVDIAKAAKAELWIFGDVYDYNVALEFDASLMDEVASLGLNLFVDINSFNKNHLENSSQLQALAESIGTIEKVRSMGAGQDEAVLIAKALKTFEDNSEDIRDTLVTDLLWEDMDEDQKAEVLREIKAKLQLIRSAIEASKYLTE